MKTLVWMVSMNVRECCEMALLYEAIILANIPNFDYCKYSNNVAKRFILSIYVLGEENWF